MLTNHLPALLARARALLHLPGGPADELSKVELRRAAAAVLALHEGLVGERELARPETYRGENLGAYLLWWWPQTYVKTQAALRMAPMPRGPRILDVGSGPGPAAAAALDLLGGSAVAFDASDEALQEARFFGVQETSRTLPQENFDLCLAANVLSELPAPIDLVRRLPGIVVLIEPALRETGRSLLKLRDQLLAEGTFQALAPCLTQKPCPALASPKDWCTADVRWTPPRYFRQLADATGLRADEMLSFAPLVLAPLRGHDERRSRDSCPQWVEPPESDVWRVVGVPQPEKGKKRVWVCSDQGREPVARLDKQAGAENADFDQLRRGDLVRLGGLERRGDGLRVVPGAKVERI